jgi:CheY-like chemotaxis protein
MRDWLGEFGFRDISVCTSVKAAQAILAYHRFEAVIIDTRLQDGSGLALAHWIRHSPEDLNRMSPVVILDGRATRKRVAVARDVGAHELVCKPLSRSFVKSSTYFGPDRRRTSSTWYGNERRLIRPRRVVIRDEAPAPERHAVPAKPLPDAFPDA